MLSLASFDRTAIGPVVSILWRQTKPNLFAKPLLGLYSPAVVEIKGNAKMLARILPHISLKHDHTRVKLRSVPSPGSTRDAIAGLAAGCLPSEMRVVANHVSS
jgi:hypothetical protein